LEGFEDGRVAGSAGDELKFGGDESVETDVKHNKNGQGEVRSGGDIREKRKERRGIGRERKERGSDEREIEMGQAVGDHRGKLPMESDSVGGHPDLGQTERLELMQALCRRTETKLARLPSA
jgi:hypothetical protein